MKRKVVQQGPATLMISLPSKWVKENKISRGKEIEVTEEHGRLTLTVDAERQAAKIEFNADGIFNEYFVNYAYQKGYDEVLIRGTDSAINTVIEKRAKQLLGFEVVEKTKNTILLKMLVTVDQQEFETVLRKLFQITLVMGDKITEALKTNNIALLEEVEQDEKENNKYSDLCVRILYKNRYKYPENGFALYSLLRELEQVGDTYKKLAVAFASVHAQRLHDLYARVHAFFRLYYEIYYAHDPEKVQRFFQIKNEITEICKKESGTKEESVIFSHLATLVQKIFDLKGVLFLQRI